MAQICLVLTASTIKENLAIVRRNRSFIDMLELRTDLLRGEDYGAVRNFPSLVDFPVILTCRKRHDGGGWAGAESLRRENLLQWMDGSFSYVDLEMDLGDDVLLLEKAKGNNITVIRSFHDFEKLPLGLYEKMTSYLSHKTVMVKGAVFPRCAEELYDLMAISLKLQSTGEMNPYILLGMGEWGFFTRILAGKLGSSFTYCSDSDSATGAPGHCSAAELNNLYHFRDIGENTPINSLIDSGLFSCLFDSPGWSVKIANLLK